MASPDREFIVGQTRGAGQRVCTEGAVAPASADSCAMPAVPQRGTCV
ncbi:MAG: hypothetical protein ACREXG_07020 [Polaromonas sp.]